MKHQGHTTSDHTSTRIAHQLSRSGAWGPTGGGRVVFPVRPWLSDPLRTVRAMLLTTSCPGCGSAGPAPCARCVAQMSVAPPLRTPLEVDRCAALLAYEGPAREVV